MVRHISSRLVHEGKCTYSERISFVYLPGTAWTLFVTGSRHTHFQLSWCIREMHLFWLDTLSSRLVHEGDASFLAGYLLLTCFTLLRTVLVSSSRHTLPSRLVHEGDASFLVGHPLLFVMSPWYSP